MYFEKFGRINYKPDTQYSSQTVVNIFNSVIAQFEPVYNTFLYYYYDVIEGERPEDVAYKAYGDSSLNWIVILLNNVVNPYYDWVLTQQELESMVDDKYDDPNGIHHFIDLTTDKRSDDYQFKINIDYFNTNGVYPANQSPVTNKEYEEELNRDKRSIRLLNKKYVPDFVRQFTRLMERNLYNIEDVSG